MKKLTKRAAIFIAVGSVVAAAGVAIPVGVIYGSSSAGTSAATLVMLDRTRNSQAVTWGTEPSSIEPPALTAEETNAPEDYEKGEFVGSNLTEATLPGSEGVNVTFLFKSKSSNRPALQITYSLDVVKAIPAKPWPEGFLLQTEGEGWPIAKGSALNQSPSEQAVKDFLRSNGYTGYNWDASSVRYYADLEGTTELTEDAFGALNGGALFYATMNFSLDTVHYFKSSVKTDERGMSVIVDYPLSGSLKVKFVVKNPVVLPTAEELNAAPFHFQYSQTPTIAAPDQLGTGYKFEKWVEMVVTAQNSTIKDEFSPPVGFRTDKPYDFKSLNAGTEFDLIYSYVPAPGYLGEKIMLTKKFVVDKQEVDGSDAYWKDREQQEIDNTYRQGDDPATAISLAPFDAKLYLDHVLYYIGDKTTDDPVDASVISGLKQDKTFRVVFVYQPTPNFVFIGKPLRSEVMITKHFKVGPPAYKVDKTDQSIKIAWSVDPKTIAAPALTGEIFTGFAEYGASSFLKATITDRTEPADKAGTITFVYSANSGSGATVEVTYSVDVVKAVPPKSWPSADLNTVTSEFVKIESSDQFSLKVSDNVNTVEAYLSSNGYVGYSVDHQTSKYTTDEQGINVITLEQYANFPPGAIVYGIYAIRLDTKHYVESSSEDGVINYFVTDGVFRVKYKIWKKVTGGSASLASATYVYGNSPDLGAPTTDSEGYSVGVLDKIEITAQTSTIKNENSPAANAVVDLAKLKTLNAGTTFRVYWKYAPDENYVGNYHFITKEFTVTKAKAIHDPFRYTGSYSFVEYGDEAPTRPIYINNQGYAEPTFEMYKISKSESEKSDEFSPAVGTIVKEINKGKLFNAGINFFVYWKFLPDPNHEGESFEVFAQYRVVKRKIPFFPNPSNDDVDTTTYKEGSNPDQVISDVVFNRPHFIFDKRIYGRKTGSGEVEYTAGEVAYHFKRGSIFYTRWFYKVDSNYEVIDHPGFILKITNDFKVA